MGLPLSYSGLAVATVAATYEHRWSVRLSPTTTCRSGGETRTRSCRSPRCLPVKWVHDGTNRLQINTLTSPALDHVDAEHTSPPASAHPPHDTAAHGPRSDTQMAPEQHA